MKKILYLTFYFEPDICAGSFRNSPLAKELSNQLVNIANVEVFTTLPNRYQSFNAEAPDEEVSANLTIRRIQLPAHKSGLIDQIFAFWKYYRDTLKTTQKEKYDLVFASSSRLFTAFLGYQIARKNAVPLILDIRDLFVDTLSDVLKNRILKAFLLPMLKIVEKRLFNYAIHINLISQGFESYFSKYFNKKFTYFTNGIDKEFIHSHDFVEDIPVSPKVITYAGNIGEGQGLHKIIPHAAQLLGNNYLFRVIGDGGAKELLVAKVKELGITNISIEPPVKRNELLDTYKKSHYLFLHLNDYQAFEKVLPSKIFELGSFPRPMIAGVGGFAHQFLLENIDNLVLFRPTDYKDFVEKLLSFEYKIVRRDEFIDKFNRDNINREMAKMIISYL